MSNVRRHNIDLRGARHLPSPATELSNSIHPMRPFSTSFTRALLLPLALTLAVTVAHAASNEALPNQLTAAEQESCTSFLTVAINQLRDGSQDFRTRAVEIQRDYARSTRPDAMRTEEGRVVAKRSILAMRKILEEQITRRRESVESVRGYIASRFSPSATKTAACLRGWMDADELLTRLEDEHTRSRLRAVDALSAVVDQTDALAVLAGSQKLTPTAQQEQAPERFRVALEDYSKAREAESETRHRLNQALDALKDNVSGKPGTTLPPK
jgi:hypothetical protein